MHLTLSLLLLLPVYTVFAMIIRTKTASGTLLRRRRCKTSMSNAAFEGFKPSETKVEAFLRSKELGRLPCIILVNPYLDSNVGSVARAMLNFGLSELRVVDPQPGCNIQSENARALAAGAVEILDNAKIFPTLEACIADLNRVLATTIRPRGMTQLIYSPEVAADLVISSLHNTSTGILFGRERSGLTNEEVALADGIIAIPTVRQNLVHILVCLYIYMYSLNTFLP